MVEVSEEAINSELALVESGTYKEEEKKTESEASTNADLSDFKPYVNYLHKTIFKALNMELEGYLIEELDSNLIKILEKRMPKLANLAENTPELTYMTLLGVAFMTSTKKIQEVKVTEVKTNDEQRDNN